MNQDETMQDLTVYDPQDFLSTHNEMVFPHRHSFYQVLYISSGTGLHVIDFEKYNTKQGSIYFLGPGQVHEWIFDASTEGTVINFSDGFFGAFLANGHYIDDFLFFTGNGTHSVMALDQEEQAFVQNVIGSVAREYQLCSECSTDLIRVYLLQMFLVLNRKLAGDQISPAHRHNYFLLRNFEKLVERHYIDKRLPKEYAEMLFITPNHLNALCKHSAGKSAGEIIRNRVLLEAKRLLINSANNISEIGWQLNFESNSYFTRFFKKYAGQTPEEFRRGLR
jgi:AraC-like DNA-binding protein